MAWNTLGRKLTWFNRPQRIPSTPEAMELHQLESRRIIRKYNDRNLFEEGNVRQFLDNTGRGGSGWDGIATNDGEMLLRIRPGHFVNILRPITVSNPSLGQQFTQYTAIEHNNGYITRIFDSAAYTNMDADNNPANPTIAQLDDVQSDQNDTDTGDADVFTPVYVVQEPQEFAGGRTIMHEYYPGERLIFMIPRRGVWLQVRVHNSYAKAFNEGDLVKISRAGTAMHVTSTADHADRNKVVGIVRQGIDAGPFTANDQAGLAATTPKYDARLVTIEIV